MSRYHPVRPKKDKPQHKPQAQAASAPAMPTEAQVEEYARDRFKSVFDELYKLRDGDFLEASIERWKRTMALYDQEIEVAKGKNGEGHRWTVSPTAALRIDTHLQKLLERREQLKMECHAEAKQIMTQFATQAAARANSLCPPKQPETAPKAASQPVAAPAQAPAKGEPAEASRIAA